MDMTPALIPSGTSSPTEDQDVPTKDHWLRGSRHVARTSTSTSTKEEPQDRLDLKDQKPSLSLERHLEQETPIFNEKKNETEHPLDSDHATVLHNPDEKEKRPLNKTLDIPQINVKHSRKDNKQKDP